VDQLDDSKRIRGVAVKFAQTLEKLSATKQTPKPTNKPTLADQLMIAAVVAIPLGCAVLLKWWQK